MPRSPWVWLIIALVILILFAGPKLPTFAKSLGQSLKIFKKEINDDANSPKDGSAGDSDKSTDTKD